MKFPTRANVECCLEDFKGFLRQVKAGKMLVIDEVPSGFCQGKILPIEQISQEFELLVNNLGINANLTSYSRICKSLVTGKAIDASDIDQAFAMFKTVANQMVKIPIRKLQALEIQARMQQM